MRIRRIIIYREFSVRSDQKYLKNRFLKSIYIFLIHFLLNDIILLSIIVNQFKLYFLDILFFFFLLPLSNLFKTTAELQNRYFKKRKKHSCISYSEIFHTKLYQIYFNQNYINYFKIISLLKIH